VGRVRPARRQACNKRPRGSGIITRPAQIPGVAQRRLVFGAPGVARQHGGVGERQALAPQAADRVIVAGDRMTCRWHDAGEKARFFVGFRHIARARPRRTQQDRRGLGDE
jgi:hypothetical protein